MQVIQVIAQGATQQELHAEIIDLLGTGLFGLFLAFVAAPDHQVPKDQGHGLVVLLVGGVFRADAEIVGELLFNHGFDLGYGKIIIHNNLSLQK